ncbi:hypothetical protein MRX96_033381 [Rhipicephalus microplus]
MAEVIVIASRPGVADSGVSRSVAEVLWGRNRLVERRRGGILPVEAEEAGRPGGQGSGGQPLDGGEGDVETPVTADHARLVTKSRNGPQDTATAGTMQQAGPRTGQKARVPIRVANNVIVASRVMCRRNQAAGPRCDRGKTPAHFRQARDPMYCPEVVQTGRMEAK